ncbi:long-chain-fatty-acid--CoA ligase 5-like isoform X1 [Anastrepha ludens]|uniref:long-chain-fatty-acid--CoA ligase 5-like isoform X1 n=1 Tax=Anastrepha ludens TaxID=28586 RepID=UPI0023AF6E98|nr:long-chain-fatty-acid--CoA ligase 5-like isoform X1 [Anastrepha ludens]
MFSSSGRTTIASRAHFRCYACNNPQVKELMLNWGKQSGLKSFEQVKDIYLHPDPFSVQNGLLTPTFKAKRPQLNKTVRETP